MLARVLTIGRIQVALFALFILGIAAFFWNPTSLVTNWILGVNIAIDAASLVFILGGQPHRPEHPITREDCTAFAALVLTFISLGLLAYSLLRAPLLSSAF